MIRRQQITDRCARKVKYLVTKLRLVTTLPRSSASHRRDSNDSILLRSRASRRARYQAELGNEMFEFANCKLQIAIAVLLLFALPAFAQRKPPRMLPDGTEGFRAVLASYKLKPITVDGLNGLKPSEVLVISFRSSDAGG